MKYILEPMLFALDEKMSESEFKIYVNRIIQWDQWLKQNPDDVYVLSDTRDLLSEKLFFPIYATFKKLMEKYKINFVQACDLNKMINQLMTRAKKIDKGTSDVVYEQQRFDLSCDGELDLTNRPDNLKNAFKRLLWQIYCMCQDKNEPIEKCVLFGRNINNNFTLDIEYSTIMEEGDNIVESDKKNDKVSLMCRSSLKDFFLYEKTPLSILQQTSCKDDISLAIRVAIYQNGHLKKVMDAYDKFDFIIQDSFYKDFCVAHYVDNDTVLNSLMEAMSHTMLNVKMDLRHEYRMDKGGSTGQKLSPDKTYAAWRRFVTSSIKMQYWQKNKHYKFANVGEHDAFVCQWEY